ncbi:hypothetical protein AB6F62_11250 [Providencia huaxiensis]|uniref:hypothetical protein n=1 Tax=Providencia huaxiensis TaxID=2027290 RepID=UPI0034DD2B16
MKESKTNLLYLPEEFPPTVSIKNVVIDLIIRNHPIFDSWCEILRRYEAYGMMRFILTSAQDDKNANDSSYVHVMVYQLLIFRQLYRENFNKTAKRKVWWCV